MMFLMATTYTLGKANLPKNILTWARILQRCNNGDRQPEPEGDQVEICIYDTKQTTKPLAICLKAPELNNVGLIIAAITNTTELKVIF